MDTGISLHVRGHDEPRVVDVTVDPLDIAHIDLGGGFDAPRLVCTNPDYLRALAIVCEEAAVRLSAALDARAARQMNAAGAA